MFKNIKIDYLGIPHKIAWTIILAMAFFWAAIFINLFFILISK